MSLDLYQELCKKISSNNYNFINELNSTLKENDCFTNESIFNYFKNKYNEQYSYEGSTLVIKNDWFLINYDPVDKEINHFSINFYNDKISYDREKSDTSFVFYHPDRKVKYKFLIRHEHQICLIDYSEKLNKVSCSFKRDISYIDNKIFPFFINNVFLPKKELSELFKLNFDLDIDDLPLYLNILDKFNLVTEFLNSSQLKNKKINKNNKI